MIPSLLVLNATFFERESLVILELLWLLFFSCHHSSCVFLSPLESRFSTELSSVGWYQDLLWLVCLGPSSP